MTCRVRGSSEGLSTGVETVVFFGVDLRVRDAVDFLLFVPEDFVRLLLEETAVLFLEEVVLRLEEDFFLVDDVVRAFVRVAASASGVAQ